MTLIVLDERFMFCDRLAVANDHYNITEVDKLFKSSDCDVYHSTCGWFRPTAKLMSGEIGKLFSSFTQMKGDRLAMSALSSTNLVSFGLNSDGTVIRENRFAHKVDDHFCVGVEDYGNTVCGDLSNGYLSLLEFLLHSNHRFGYYDWFDFSGIDNDPPYVLKMILPQLIAGIGAISRRSRESGNGFASLDLVILDGPCKRFMVHSELGTGKIAFDYID